MFTLFCQPHKKGTKKVSAKYNFLKSTEASPTDKINSHTSVNSGVLKQYFILLVLPASLICYKIILRGHGSVIIPESYFIFSVILLNLYPTKIFLFSSTELTLFRFADGLLIFLRKIYDRQIPFQVAFLLSTIVQLSPRICRLSPEILLRNPHALDERQ